MRTLVILTVIAVAAAAAFAATGSIISSFNFNTGSYLSGGVYRNVAGVFTLLCPGDHRYPFIRYLSTTGSVLGTYPVNMGLCTPEDHDACHLGAGYLAVVNSYSSNRRLFCLRTVTGAVAGSFALAEGAPYPKNVLWDGTYYYVNGYNDKGTFYRYTSAGSAVNSWTAAGWPAAITACGGIGYAANVNGTPGRYLIANSAAINQPSAVINMNTGSLVATFSHVSHGLGSCVGPSSDSVKYGNVFWSLWYNSPEPLRVYEIDLGVTLPVAPASVGRIKAVFR
jgi:hypothetical protein